MDTRAPWPELGVRWIERHIEIEAYSGRMQVIETVGEYVGTWEGEACVYRFAVHWLPDFDSETVELYDKLPANDAIARFKRMSIPQSLLSELKGFALSELLKKTVEDTLTENVKVVPRSQHVVEIRFKKEAKPYILVYAHMPDDSIMLTETIDKRPARADAARRGHSRIPKQVCIRAYELANDYFHSRKSIMSRQDDLFASHPTL